MGHCRENLRLVTQFRSINLQNVHLMHILAWRLYSSTDIISSSLDYSNFILEAQPTRGHHVIGVHDFLDLLQHCGIAGRSLVNHIGDYSVRSREEPTPV
jgi:hypothetical protein